MFLFLNNTLDDSVLFTFTHHSLTLTALTHSLTHLTTFSSIMSAFEEPSTSSEDFSVVQWDDGHQPGGAKKAKAREAGSGSGSNPTRMALNHGKAGE